MKRILLAVVVLGTLISCAKKEEKADIISDNIACAVAHNEVQTRLIEESGKVLIPRTIEDGKIKYVSTSSWVSGFYAGSIWYMYELTGDEKWKNLAVKYTEHLEEVKNLKWHHDIGFMIECSYGNGLRLAKGESYKDVIITAAQSLSTRFRPNAGVIQSWNVTGNGWQSKRGWECPVIIDNMMNLELLFNATKLSGDSTFFNIAVSHADKTIENHYRPDNSCYHVIDYSIEDGSVRHKHTAQGYAHESAWARGQAWGIYGFTVCYRETGDIKYLKQAEKAFEFVVNHKNFPADFIPYWDLDAPGIPDEPRDASTAAIMASALYEMSTYEKSDYYKSWADKIVTSLSSDQYRATPGTNGNFILKHSVGSIPHGAEIDVPLNYADYYFLEALKRKRELERN
uniref:glycoside hydrolase family 88 protein n=1 Tax=uncultured Draconibacterium sp. TaxID=1573823 RepID=UPI00321683C1